MTISCTNKEKKTCEHRRAGLCFNPCVLKAAKAGLQFRKLIDSGKLNDTTQKVL